MRDESSLFEEKLYGEKTFFYIFSSREIFNRALKFRAQVIFFFFNWHIVFTAKLK